MVTNHIKCRNAYFVEGVPNQFLNSSFIDQWDQWVLPIDFENITVIYIAVISIYYLFHLNFHYNHIGLGGDCNDGPFKGCNSKPCTIRCSGLRRVTSLFFTKQPPPHHSRPLLQDKQDKTTTYPS